MIPREVIKRNLRFTCPSRIGLAFDSNKKNDFCQEVKISPKGYKQKRWIEGKFEYYDDPWGNIWYRIIDMAKGGEIFKPAISDWSMLKDYKLPDFLNSPDFENIKKIFDKDKGEHYRLVNLPGFPFSISRYLRKMEDYFQDLILERENIDKLHNMVTSLLEEVIKKIPVTGADGVILYEDWGTQDRLLIHPNMWREIFKPLFKRLCDVAHSVGLDVLMHSCGYNWDILDDLAEAGINAFQFDQPSIYGLERLANKLQSLKVCLFSPVDIQKVLSTGNKEIIINEVHMMVKLFFRDKGGFIAKNYGDLVSIGVKPEWDDWAYETFLEYCK
ncbi:MAG: uroporphyrinogen decarboxylase family protein [Candidatus Firestonebacteria bacterium]